MKKVLSVLLSAVIVATQLPFISFAVSGEEDVSSFETFAAQVTELISEYDNEEYSVVTEEKGKTDSSVQTEDEDIFDNTQYMMSYDSANDASAEVKEYEDTSNVDYTNRLIVKSEDDIDTLDAVGYVSGYNDIHVLQFANSEDFTEAFEYYSNLDSVEYLEEDLMCEITDYEISSEETTYNENPTPIPTEIQTKKFGYSALKQYFTDNSVDLSNEIAVAVVDTGIAYDHDFLVDRVEPTGFNSVSDASEYDDNGHGTHIAGIIAANTFDNVVIKPYKVLNDGGQGSALQVYLGIEAAVADDVDIINLSLSIRGENELLHEAVTDAYDEGIVVVASAGNKGVDLSQVYYSPACFDEVITVMACSDSYYVSSFSNYGSLCDVAAPGVDIYSTYLDNGYKTLSGTSMSTPFVVAAVTFLLIDDSTLTPDTVNSSLKNSTFRCQGSKKGKYLNVEYLTRIKAETAAPVFSKTTGYFSEPFELTLTCATDSAVIYYTSSAFGDDHYEEYTEPIYISCDTTISAYAQKPDSIASATLSHQYTRSAQDASLFTVNSAGELTAYSGTEADVVVPLNVNGVKVTSVADGAFKNNTHIKTIAFLTGVTTIGEESFSGCTNLEYIRGAGLTTIGEKAFYGCEKLRIVNSSSIQKVGDYAFYNCAALTSFTFVGVTSVGAYAFSNTNKLSEIGGNAFTSIGEYSFYNSGITSVNMQILTSVPANAFLDCSNLQSVSLSRTTAISASAFENCTGLISFEADSAVSIEDNALLNCSELEGISINSMTAFPSQTGVSSYFSQFPELAYISANSVTEIPANAFSQNTSLTDISFDSAVFIGSNAFKELMISELNFPALSSADTGAFNGCSAIVSFSAGALSTFSPNIFTDSLNIEELYLSGTTSVSLGSSVTGFKDAFPKIRVFHADNLGELPAYAFDDCDTVEDISLANVGTIGDYAFRDCDGIKTIDISKVLNIGNYAFCNSSVSDINGIKATLGSYAFADCNNLTEVNISSKIIGDYAFKDCKNITSFVGKSATTIGEKILLGCDELTTLEFSLLNTLESPSGITQTFSYLPELTELILTQVDVIPAEYFADFPKLETAYMYGLNKVPSYAFTGCETLKTVYITYATSIESYAFYECDALEYVGAANTTSIGSHAFYGCENLKEVYAPKTTKVNSYAFYGCDKLETVTVYSARVVDDYAFYNVKCEIGVNTELLTDIGDYAFYGCENLPARTFDNLVDLGSFAFAQSSVGGIVEFPALKTVASDAFSGCDFERVMLEKVVTLSDLPDNSIVLIGSKATIIDAEPPVGTTIYGTKGTLSQTYATENGVEFVPFNGTNAIIEDLPELFTDYSEGISMDVIGFNLRYEWYASDTDPDCMDDITYLGRMKELYPADNIYRYYACDVYSTENGKQVYIMSAVTENVLYSLEAASGNTIDRKNGIVCSSVLKSNDAKDFITHDDTLTSCMKSCGQYYGTGSVISVTYKNEPEYELTLSIKGDINGDGVIDVLDAAISEKRTNSKVELEDVYEIAADYNGDGKYNTLDYQQIVNKALEA